MKPKSDKPERCPTAREFGAMMDRAQVYKLSGHPAEVRVPAARELEERARRDALRAIQIDEWLREARKDRDFA